MKPFDPRWRNTLIWCIAVTAAVETVTIVARFTSGTSAADFQAAHALPLPLCIHHLFWGFPPIIIAAFAWQRPKPAGALLGLGLGLILSDVIHHCIVLPLTVGNMGWHWP